MANADYKIGDIVQLRSGGPKMTISSLRDNHDDYMCVWFRGSNRENGYFKDEVLRKVDE